MNIKTHKSLSRLFFILGALGGATIMFYSGVRYGPVFDQYGMLQGIKHITEGVFGWGNYKYGLWFVIIYMIVGLAMWTIRPQLPEQYYCEKKEVA